LRLLKEVDGFALAGGGSVVWLDGGSVMANDGRNDGGRRRQSQYW
jgi:hypothetical protein